VATVYTDLIPTAIASEIVGAVTDEQSALMQLARTVPMPSGVEKVPVVSSAPASGFVTPAYGGLKPSGTVDWTGETLTAAEIGTVVAIPQAFIDDTTYPVWDSVRSEIAKSFARVFDQAALCGTNAPGAWPSGGLTAAAQADVVTGAGALEAIDAGLSNLEAKGIEPDGILGGSALRAALRAQMVTTLQPFSEAPPQIYGVPVAFSSNWNDAVGLALVGGFEAVLVGVRQDLTYDMSEDAVISDATGKVIANMFQQDSVAMRCFWRIALAEAKPIGSAGTPVKPLALTQSTGAAAARSSKSKS
jgi:hypothetical protein